MTAGEGGHAPGTGPNLQECEAKIGYVFRDQSLMLAALTHASGAPTRLASNERLEFLGDSILGMLVCELLFRRFPNQLEGDLTKTKSVVVSRQACARIARRLELEKHLVLGKGMMVARKLPGSLLAGAFESLMAAIYLDGGLEAARGIVTRIVITEIEDALVGEHGDNYKSLLQQLAQREYSTTPTYQVLDEKGPDHRKEFHVAARIGAEDYAPAWGHNKKEAEQKAAQNALDAINGNGSDGKGSDGKGSDGKDGASKPSPPTAS